MGKRLTSKEMAFSEAIAAGDTVAVAYKKSYDTELTGQMLHNSGKRVLERPHVRERIEEIEKGVLNSTVEDYATERRKQIAFIESRIEHCKKKEDEQSVIRYTDMLNRIHGFYKAESADPQQDNALNSVSADVLQKIAESI